MRKLSISKPKITTEQWVLTLLTVAPPLIAFIYLDWRAALSALLITQIAIGLIKLRYS